MQYFIIINIYYYLLLLSLLLAIINACTSEFPEAAVACCFFHLGQSVYRRVQAEGLQEAYNDPVDRSIKLYTHMAMSLSTT